MVCLHNHISPGKPLTRLQVLHLDKLRDAATSEFELRGPFPSRAYARIMDSTNKMLEAFHAMNVVIQKDLQATEGEALLLKFTAEERADLCARISHLFQGDSPPQVVSSKC